MKYLATTSFFVLMTSFAAAQTSSDEANTTKDKILQCFDVGEWLRETCVEAALSSKTDKSVDPSSSEAAKEKPEKKSELQSEPKDMLKDVEVHVIGIYEKGEENPRRRFGSTSQEPPIVLDENTRGVPVFVNRPGKNVHLVFSSHDSTLWNVTASPGTKIVDISVFSDTQPSVAKYKEKVFKSETRLQGGTSYTLDSQRFYTFYDSIISTLKIKEISSFSGDYYAPSQGFDISSADPVPNETEKWNSLYEKGVTASSLPESLRSKINTYHQEVIFTDDGFKLVGDGNNATIPLPPGINLSWPVSKAAASEQKGKLWGVTSHVDSYLYEYDVTSDEWKKVHLGRAKDFGGIHYDEEKNTLILSEGQLRGGSRLNLLEINADTLEKISETSLDVTGLGLKMIYDPGNGPSPVFDVLGSENNQILLRASLPHHAPRNGTGPKKVFFVVSDFEKATLVNPNM